MDIRINLGNLSTPNDVLRLTSIISEMADVLDVLSTTTAPNGVTSARQGKIAVYDNGVTRELWVNTDGATAWERMDSGALTSPMLYGDTRFAVGSFTIDLSTTGTQAVSGVGFSPKVVIFIAGIDATTGGTSWGFDNQVTNKAFYGNSTAGQYNYVNGASIFVAVSAGVNNQSKITTLSSDGFTITKTKSGSPTGTANVIYLALR